MHYAEKALPPTAERKKCHRRGDANVDAYIACLSFIAKFARRSAVGGEQTGHVPIITAIHQRDGIIDGLYIDQAQHRAKDFRFK